MTSGQTMGTKGYVSSRLLLKVLSDSTYTGDVWEGRAKGARQKEKRRRETVNGGYLNWEEIGRVFNSVA